MTLGANCFAQKGKISTGSTSDFEDTVTGSELKTANRFSANSGREQEKQFEEREEACDIVVPLGEEGGIAANPVCRPHRILSPDPPPPTQWFSRQAVQGHRFSPLP